MAHAITIPAVGESITEGVIARWLVEDGSYVTDGSPIYELETDKISTEVEADASGAITIKVPEGETVEVGATVAEIDTSAVAPAGDEDVVQPTDRQRSVAEVQAEKAAKGIQPADDDTDTHNIPPESSRFSKDGPDKATGTLPPMSPAVRKLVEEHKLDPAQITGSGKDGRLTKGDVLAWLERPPTPSKPSVSPESAIEPKPAAAKATPAPTSSSQGEKRTRMSPLRKRIAQRLVNAQRTAAILTTFNEIDMSACMAMRSRFKGEFEEKHGVRLGFMSFFTKACVHALKEVPEVNAEIDGTDVVYKNFVHMGVAVGTPTGLVVPVVRDADQMSFHAIEQKIAELGLRARDGKLSMAEMQGGTFTISNGGVYGSLMSSPILNPPQSGILGMHKIQDRPVVVNGQIVIRPMMYLALSYDHRIVDGKGAVTFLVRVKEALEDPRRLLMDL